MSDLPDGVDGRAAALRQAFDASFADAPRTAVTDDIELLAIRTGGARFLIALAEIDSLHADLPVTRIPTAQPHVLGVAAIRGRVVAVHDIGHLVGRARSEKRPRWMVAVRGRDVALAFEQLDGQFRRRPADGRTAGEAPGSRGVTRVFDIDGVSLPLLSLSELYGQAGDGSAG